jgi:glycosyltransferase involved in cell wall biosynthesis
LIRVLQVIPCYGTGGAERMGVHLMLNLDRKRFEIGAISLYDPAGTGFERSLARDNVPVWYLGKRRGPDPHMLPRIASVIRRFRPHVVHTHRYVLRYTLPLASYRRVPARVHTVHNLAEKEVDWPGRWVHRLAFRQGVLPVSIGQAVTVSLMRTYGIDYSPTIPYGIPVQEYRTPSITREVWREREGFAPKDLLFVCVARFAPQKNHALLLESFAQGPAKDPHAYLLLVGSGKLELEVKKQAEALGLRDKARFLGKRADIPEILNAADVFVLASDWEGNPLSIMEAMAAGKPVICTAVGGVPELVEDGQGGLIVPQRDRQALAEAMSYMLEDPEARSSMGSASARRAMSHFDRKAMTEAYEDLYTTILARTNALPRAGSALR